MKNFNLYYTRQHNIQPTTVNGTATHTQVDNSTAQPLPSDYPGLIGLICKVPPSLWTPIITSDCVHRLSLETHTVCYGESNTISVTVGTPVNNKFIASIADNAVRCVVTTVEGSVPWRRMTCPLHRRVVVVACTRRSRLRVTSLSSSPTKPAIAVDS